MYSRSRLRKLWLSFFVFVIGACGGERFDSIQNLRSAGETIICWRGAVRPFPAGAAAPGEIVAAADGAITVACGQGALALLELQRPGGRRMTAAEFLRGRPPAPGARFELPSTPAGAGGAGSV